MSQRFRKADKVDEGEGNAGGERERKKGKWWKDGEREGKRA